MKFVISLAVIALIPGGFAQTLAPSPTESVGCEPHDDHWHCDGPVSTTSQLTTTFLSFSGSATTLTTTAEDHEDHDHESGTGSIAPSPTESVGCEPHGDHWHCDGPAVTSSAANSTTSSTSTSRFPTMSSSSTTETGSAATTTASAGSTTAENSLRMAVLLGSFTVALGLCG